MEQKINRDPNSAFVWKIWKLYDNGCKYIYYKDIEKLEENFKKSDIYDLMKHGDIIRNTAYTGFFDYNIFVIYKKDGHFKILSTSEKKIPNRFYDGEKYTHEYWKITGWDLEKKSDIPVIYV